MKNLSTKVFLAALIAGIIFLSGCGHTSNVVNIPQENTGSLITPWGTTSGVEVPGEDLKCVGRYDNSIRTLYNKDTDEDGSYYISIVYYKKGNDFDNAKSYLTKKLQECGYHKDSESEGAVSIPGFQIVNGYKGDYYSKDGDSLSAEVTTMKLNKETYTFISINYEHSSDYSEEENTSDESETQESDPYVSAEEAQPNGALAKKFDSIIKPALVSIYSGAKLTKSSTTKLNGVEEAELTYIVKRKVNQNDDSSLAAIITNNGYQLVSDEVSDSDISITSVKNDKPALSIEASIGEQEIDTVGYDFGKS